MLQGNAVIIYLGCRSNVVACAYQCRKLKHAIQKGIFILLWY
jgi:hypothetical protein